MSNAPFDTRKFNVAKVFVHLFFWFGLLFLFSSKFLGISWGPFSSTEGTLLIPMIYGMAINAILFYAICYWLIPLKLLKKKRLQFITWSLFLLILLSTVEQFLDILYLDFIDEDNINDINTTELAGNQLTSFIFVHILFVFFTNLLWSGFAFLYRWPGDWMKNERQKQRLKEEKLSAELELLKAQINPHFLFNGINSIYHLIGLNDEAAQKLLLEFSNLLRYQLYECNEEYIPLNKELNYIKNYINIEETRKGEDAVIIKDFPANTNEFTNYEIAPLLISTFLENAFKHLSLYSKKEDNQVDIKFKIIDNFINFSVKNTIDKVKESSKMNPVGSLGLRNVKRRLELIYKDNYLLDISSRNNYFEVNLKINLS